jgi:hypothetical protein
MKYMIKRAIRETRILNFFPRLYQATRYFNGRYPQILKWALTSREDTNYTYHITPTSRLYMAYAIAEATGVGVSDVERYFQEIETDEAFARQIVELSKQGPDRFVSDDSVRLGRRIGWYAFVRILKPGVVVETGVDKGLGGATLCQALLRNAEEGRPGRYFGTDINPSAGFLLQAKFTEVGKILYGDSIESLSKFTDEIDIFINDSDHSAEYEYREYMTIRPLLGPRSIILGDNSHCTDRLARFSGEFRRQFLFVKEEPEDHWYPGAGIGISFVR